MPYFAQLQPQPVGDGRRQEDTRPDLTATAGQDTPRGREIPHAHRGPGDAPPGNELTRGREKDDFSLDEMGNVGPDRLRNADVLRPDSRADLFEQTPLG